MPETQEEDVITRPTIHNPKVSIPLIEMIRARIDVPKIRGPP